MRPRASASPLFPAAAAVLIAAVVAGATLTEWRLGLRPEVPLEPLSIANALSRGEGFSNPFWRQTGPTAWVTPAVPLVYAGSILLSKATGASALGLVAGFSLLCVALAAWLILRYCIGAWSPCGRCLFCAVLAAYLVADGNALTYPGALIAAETALLLAGLAETGRSGPRARGPALMFAGETLLTLTHPGLAAAGFVAIAARGLSGSRSRLRPCLAALASSVLVGVVPWAVRNRAVFHEWIASKSNGAFELVLSQEQTDDGVLAESAILAGNPSLNARLQAEYGLKGEKLFLAPYRKRAWRILADDTARYILFCRNRACNALVLCKSTSDTEHVSVPLDPEAARTMVGRGLLLYFMSATPEYVWRRSSASKADEIAALRAADIPNAGAVADDWSRAQVVIRARASSTGALLRRFAWSGLPSLCLLATAICRRDRRSAVALAAGALYLLALVPNILITHDIRHQADFSLPFALFAAAAVECWLRRSPGPPDAGPGT